MSDPAPELVPADFYPRLVAALVEARGVADLRQRDVAARLGRPQAFVSRYETLERRLDVADYAAVARAVGADPVALFARVLKDGAN